MALLEVEGLSKHYRSPDGARRTVLDVPHLALEAGAELALEGRSGSGKTTLLNILCGLTVPNTGSVTICGADLTRMSEAERDRFRALHVGVVHQSFQLLAGYSAIENVLLGMAFGRGPDRPRARKLLERLELADHADHLPRALSIGQQQRVALARALAGAPELILADEPTGSLDRESAAVAIELLRTACHESGAALLIVSHDRDVLARFEHRIDFATLNRASGGVRT